MREDEVGFADRTYTGSPLVREGFRAYDERVSEMTRLTEAYDRGRADERAAVVEWLRRSVVSAGASGDYAAERVAAEDHLAGGPYRQHVWDGDCWCQPTVEEVPGR